jgi:hypothetical protein
LGTFATTTSLDTLIPGVDLSTVTASSLASKCITWAENHVKAKLAKRYDVSSWNTSTSVPPQITSITEMLASGYFFKKISRGAPASIERGNESLADGNEQLMALANRDCDLVDTAGSFVNERTDEVSETVISSTTAYHTTFDEDDPINWVIDPDKVSDIQSGRL